MDEETKEILEMATKKFGAPDLIVNIYSMEFLWASEKVAKALGYTVQELSGMSLRKLMSFDHHEIMRMTMRILGKKTEDTKILKKKNGEKVRAKGMVHSLMHDKEPYLVIVDATFSKLES